MGITGRRRYRGVKYQVIDERDHLLIKISGETRENEALLVKKMLSPYLNRKGTTVILDLKELIKFEPVVLMGVLNGIKKEIELSKGKLKLRSPRPEIALYLKENRLDRIFQLCDDKEDSNPLPKEA
jgi:anti-anti-sigma factor